MDYPGDAFHTFLDLDSVTCYIQSMGQSQVTPGFYLKYLKLCSEDEQSFYGVGMTCGLVNSDKMFILGWSNTNY